MSIKVKTPKEIIKCIDDLYAGEYYLCPTCLNEVKNKDQVCKYCNEELKENKWQN